MSAMDMAEHQVPGSQSAFYIPNFVTPEEEEFLVRKILDSPRQRWKYLANRRLADLYVDIVKAHVLTPVKYSLQLLGGEMTSKNILLPQDMPPFLKTYPDLIGRLKNTGAFNSSPHGVPNHVILNEYLPGQGIMVEPHIVHDRPSAHLLYPFIQPHEDGPTYHPVVATVSLGSHAVFHYYGYKKEGNTENPEDPKATPDGGPIDSTPLLSVLLEPRSVIITTSTLYTSNLHGIQELEEDVLVLTENNQEPLVAGLGTPIANRHMLAGMTERTVAQSGGVIKRGTRYSLTCRDVERVALGKGILRR